jgi:hypothetical protein
MKDKHITEILDSMPLSDLSESDLESVRIHAALCSDCRRAYEAAQLSTLLLQERAAETFEPTPFFQTRVLAALRERQAQSKSVFQRLWEASGALVTSMAATVALLAVLTFFVPGIQPAANTQQQEIATASSSYSADEVFFNQGESPAEQMSYEQVLTTLYESDEGALR